ncbi:MAG TPA: hypothetical protein V6C97_17775 [Oculatellaceae cyanobacterium]
MLRTKQSLNTFPCAGFGSAIFKRDSIKRRSVLLLAFAFIVTSVAQYVTLISRPACISAYAAASRPKIFLWAWERRDDLKTIPADYGVAYLAATIRIVGDRVVSVPRRQPLFVPRDIELISVFRIEVLHGRKPKLDDRAIENICKIIGRWKNYPRAESVQIDFDALQSERGFYSRLLKRLQTELPAQCPVAITALTSWCLCDNWMKDLPVAEKIPMLFSMGRESSGVVAHLSRVGAFDNESCRQSLGVSLDEAKVNDSVLSSLCGHEQIARLYIFSSQQWSPELVSAAVKLASSAI